MKIIKALKMRIYPSAVQKHVIDQTIGCVRFVFNHMLDRNNKVYDRRGEHLSYNEMQNLLPGMKNYLPWLKEADSQALKYACRQVDNAYQRFFKKNGGRPKFKSRKHSRLSYTTTASQTIDYDPDNRRVKLPCLGWMTCSDIRILKGCKFKRATISCKNGRYYVSITYEIEKDIVPVQIEDESQVCGMDYKSDGLYVNDIGYSPKMPHYFRKAEKKLRHEQRKLSHMIESHVVGYKQAFGKRYPVYDRKLAECRNIQKQRQIVAAAHETIANQRSDYLHKETTRIVRQYAAVCVEDLDMKALSNKEFGNGKATLDNGYGMFISMLDYKLKERGGYLVKVDRFFPSSQTCSCCGAVNSVVKDLCVREWDCPSCGTHHDRDINAAINIKREGMRILMNA